MVFKAIQIFLVKNIPEKGHKQKFSSENYARMSQKITKFITI